MQSGVNNIFEFLDTLMAKVESIEKKVSGKTQDKIKDYLDIDELILYLKEKSITVSKSKIYKLTRASSGGLPHRKVCARLIFSKREIDLWIDLQINPQSNKKSIGKLKAGINNNKIKNYDY